MLPNAVHTALCYMSYGRLASTFIVGFGAWVVGPFRGSGRVEGFFAAAVAVPFCVGCIWLIGYIPVSLLAMW
jgi:hypothetical protein